MGAVGTLADEVDFKTVVTSLRTRLGALSRKVSMMNKRQSTPAAVGMAHTPILAAPHPPSKAIAAAEMPATTIAGTPP